ncbi:tripartite tricarboxylate transporter permease [Halalkalibacter oceani]|uniref:tripartite tricarboxylate transporter permease n=1 Tax=Halalkalibacter oceani TaxID=1653776 RepID=UPI00203CA5AD|nr:tripartite tricarboxylate transporter permease [Halalkalibacter oceani]MCM3761989.1 tripartite tricarboxylate transporter permease [Halalkalibacter oceani]
MDLFLSTLMESMLSGAIFFLLVGVFIGIIVGSIPGLNATMAVAILVPVTFGFDSVSAILLLVGVYVGGISGGLVASTLLGIPGTPSSVATTFDAYPMTKNGEPVRALGIGIIATLVGGLIGGVFLITSSVTISQFAVRLGPPQFFSLVFFAILLISVLSRGNMIKGFTSGLLGVAIALVGFSPIDGSARLTFGISQLNSGVSLVAVIMGLFAISQILSDIEKGDLKTKTSLKIKGIGISISETFANMWNMIRSSLIGVGFGVLPGLGAGASNLVAYAQAKQTSKNKKNFGKGAPEGIYASESSNNAALGGALIPLLSLGIPGDTVTAILLGGFMIHGIQPGPMLFTSNPDIVYVVFIGFFLSIIAVFALQLLGMRLFPKILMIPNHYLFSIILMLTVVGVYADNYLIFDVWLMVLLGVVGLILMKNNFPFAPLILGFVLGPIGEDYLRRGLMQYGNIFTMLNDPISIILVSTALIVFFYSLYSEVKNMRSATN